MVTLSLADHRVEVLTDPDPGLRPGDVSVPERLQLPASDGDIVHAVYYPPTNHAVTGPPGQRPPLIVQPHPGPTSDARVRLELRTQFFTSRGFAVVDVNYRGSTGYGRAYRAHLDGHLVGPWPEAAHLYRERSPVHNADEITQPVLVIHGFDDEVVPAEQADAIVAALRQHAVPVTELSYPGEDHGLRRSDNIQRALEAELTFHRTALNRGS